MDEKQKPDIFSPVTDWKDLQNKICLLFNQIGLNAETEKIIETPRGEVEVDVFAIDPKSVDKISYLVECKNWNTPVNQSVIHSFTTIMNETGCNIGYIISKNGFQAGAKKYVRNTNIKLFTFEDIQSHYWYLWIRNYFVPQIKIMIERYSFYCEPFNSSRDRVVNQLDPLKKELYIRLYKKYAPFFSTLDIVSSSIHDMMKLDMNSDHTLIKWDEFICECNKMNIDISSSNLLSILDELEVGITSITQKFDAIFESDIYM